MLGASPEFKKIEKRKGGKGRKVKERSRRNELEKVGSQREVVWAYFIFNARYNQQPGAELSIFLQALVTTGHSPVGCGGRRMGSHIRGEFEVEEDKSLVCDLLFFFFPTY